MVLKKAVQQGHRERRGEEVPTALRAGRSPVEWILANGKAPPVLPTSHGLPLNVELLSKARTPLADFFSTLIGAAFLRRASRSRKKPEGPRVTGTRICA